MAEKTPRQKKRKASQEVAPLPDDEKRWKPLKPFKADKAETTTLQMFVSAPLHFFPKIIFVPRLSKRARAPPTIYESPDPEMTQILKTIKKQEEEDKRSATSTSDKEDEKPLRQRAKKKQPARRQAAKKNVPAEDSDSDLDEPPSPKATGRGRPKSKSNGKATPQTNKKGDPVFFK